MYNLEYLPVARQDMIDIVRYIGVELANPVAADRLATELIEAGESIPKFPYANPACARTILYSALPSPSLCSIASAFISNASA